jgi:hypothetical protein
MFAARRPSFHSLVQLRASKPIARWLGTARMPCEKEMAIVSETIDADPLRDCLGLILHKLRRNKVVTPRHGLMLAAIDGHETHSSYKRCHEGSLERKITIGDREVIQYYHRFAVFQIIGENFYLPFDAEPVRPGEDEVAAALRLLARVLANYPRCFDVLTADAIYLRPSVIDLLRSAGKHLVATLKENQPELLGEARLLLPDEPAHCLNLPDTPGKSSRVTELRQADGFTTESIHSPLRVVHSHETGIRHERIAKKSISTPYATDWYWATTMPSGFNSPTVVHECGHNRWCIENEGFNELVSRWNSRHVFHHHGNSILVLWLTMFIAHAVFYCFLRNLAPALRWAHTTVHFAERIAADLIANRWWPPHPP